MPRTSGEIDIRALVQGFIGTLVSAVEQNTAKRIEAAILNGVGVSAPRRGPGRPPKNGLFSLSAARLARGPSKPRAKQLCPVPGCKNPAAPVFGMVCAKHKDVPKAKIKEYRETRRRAKARTKTAGRSNGKPNGRKPAPRRRATKPRAQLAKPRPALPRPRAPQPAPAAATA
jgi:hypothetical protein